MATEYKTLPIGKIFTYNGNEYEVCEDNNIDYICNQCAFNGINCDSIKNIRGNCTISGRTDCTQVYYKQINNKTMKKDSDNVVCPTFNTNDSLNDLHIECPEGYSIDVEHSDLSKGIIKFKNDNITLEDIYENQGKDTFITNIVSNNTYTYNKISAIATLLDIANYYNKGWKPDFNNKTTYKYVIQYNGIENKHTHYSVDYDVCLNRCCVYFKNQEDAQSVINNPNFRDILDTIYKD